MALLDPQSLLSKSLLYSNVPSPQRLVYTSAQLGTDADGNTPEDFESQVKNALKNILRSLGRAGGSMRDIVKVNLYVVGWNPERELELESALIHTLSDKKGAYHPLSTLIPVATLRRPEFLFQVDAVAAIQEAQQAVVELPRNVSTLTTDVIIVGAGLSGLQAAHDIKQAGYSCVVLEAMDRVGGKTLSHLCKENGTVDLGAAWLNDASHSKLFELTRKYGLETVIQRTDGDEVLQDLEGNSERWEYGTVPKVGLSVLCAHLLEI